MFHRWGCHGGRGTAGCGSAVPLSRKRADAGDVASASWGRSAHPDCREQLALGLSLQPRHGGATRQVKVQDRLCFLVPAFYTGECERRDRLVSSRRSGWWRVPTRVMLPLRGHPSSCCPWQAPPTASSGSLAGSLQYHQLFPSRDSHCTS